MEEPVSGTFRGRGGAFAVVHSLSALPRALGLQRITLRALEFSREISEAGEEGLRWDRRGLEEEQRLGGLRERLWEVWEGRGRGRLKER